ncbi:dynamin family [Hyaloscypha variabilis]
METDTNSSLENLQTDEQRRLLDMVVQMGKRGLNGTLPLPQLVVRGNQSAGKSSVLEALTGIPFPRSDNLCTRFATEISLRCADVASLTIKIKSFERSITNFDELPGILNEAMAVMGVSRESDPDSKPRAFARDVLSIEIYIPSNPQLTVVDIPGLIATTTKGFTGSSRLLDRGLSHSTEIFVWLLCRG